MATNNRTRTRINKQTDEEKILGIKPSVTSYKEHNYEDKNIQYRVTNLEVNNNPIYVRGNLIETFIGAKNTEARKQLKNGEKKVICKDIYGKQLYKIEVID